MDKGGENQPIQNSSTTHRGHHGTKVNAKKRPPATIDSATLQSVISHVKKQRTSVVVEAEKLDILLLHAELRHEHHRQVLQTPAGRRPKGARVTPRISELLHRKKDIVRAVWNDYWNDEKISVALPPGNYVAKTTLVPRVAMVAAYVQQFVRERRAVRQRTVARDVMDLLARIYVIHVDYDSPTAVASAERSVRRYLRHLGYKRGKKKGGLSYHLREENARKRDVYLSTMMQVKDSKQRRVVYLDESYVHHNYARHDDSLFDPNDEQDLQVAVKHKGRRYCFIAAIVDADPTIDDTNRTETQQAHLLPETLDIFEGGKKQTKDYHGMFNSDYFERWMALLLDTLDARNIKNAYIAMDNAKYHCRLPPGTPTGATKKDAMLDKCREWGVDADSSELKKAIWAKLKEHVRTHVSPVVVEMARTRGHTVVYTPPHHSDLQPIETVWAIVKGEVGRKYTSESTFSEVRARLDMAFVNIKSATIQKCINKANHILGAIYEQVRRAEEGDDDTSDDIKLDSDGDLTHSSSSGSDDDS
jgi:hypothetical protein